MKINGQDKGAVVQRSYRPKPVISIPVIKLKKTLIIVCSTTIIQGINAALQKIKALAKNAKAMVKIFFMPGLEHTVFYQ